jgi:hypothetical protein
MIPGGYNLLLITNFQFHPTYSICIPILKNAPSPTWASFSTTGVSPWLNGPALIEPGNPTSLTPEAQPLALDKINN